MRVILDINGLYTAQAGVARYIRGLLKGFERARHPWLEIHPSAMRAATRDSKLIESKVRSDARANALFMKVLTGLYRLLRPSALR